MLLYTVLLLCAGASFALRPQQESPFLDAIHDTRFVANLRSALRTAGPEQTLKAAVATLKKDEGGLEKEIRSGEQCI